MDKWYDSEGKKYTDEDVIKWVKEEMDDTDKSGINRILAIGTDSHRHGLNFRFIRTVGVVRQGKGSFYLFKISYEPKAPFKGKQQIRMFREVEMSCDLADWLLDATGHVAEVHIDASPEESNEFTSKFSNQLVGFAVGRGYKGLTKPDSYMASCVSDRHTK